MTAAPADVVGVGLCTVDYLFALPAPPTFKSTQRASAFLRQGGGPVPTALVALSRLGARTRFLARVGDDEEGDFIRAGLQKEGVDIDHMRVQPGALSRVALVLVEQGTGERGFVSRPETCQPLSAAEIRRSELAGARLLHLDDADEACLQAARLAREEGLLVSFDGTWQHESLDELLPLIDAPIVSEPFARRWMPGAPPADVVARLSTYGGRLAVLTLGSRGCVARWNDRTFSFPAFPVDPKDTTGAGDAFHGGLLYGLLQDWSPERTLPFASALAALNCLSLGGRSGLPTLSQVESFLQEHPPLTGTPLS